MSLKAYFLSMLDEIPICPNCDAGDPTSAEPSPVQESGGAWRCRSCAHRWIEETPEPLLHAGGCPCAACGMESGA